MNHEPIPELVDLVLYFWGEVEYALGASRRGQRIAYYQNKDIVVIMDVLRRV
jgi:hypothetical protein